MLLFLVYPAHTVRVKHWRFELELFGFDRWLLNIDMVIKIKNDVIT
jgi:hypothetical protein